MMTKVKTPDELTDELIALAFAEDIGDGDHTTLCCIPPEAAGKSRLIIKEDGVLAGVEMARRIFDYFDPAMRMEILIHDGAEVKKGDIAFTVEGKVRSILQTERLVLNVMQRMSGIATTTRRYVKALEGLPTRVLDTRKTTPGMRIPEKEAVRIGGGANHRIGLFDMILLKDNHVDFAGGIEQAITQAHHYLKETGKKLKIEIEVRNFEELDEVLRMGGVDRIMLDNFNTEDTREAVKRIAGRYETESSGGITFETLRQYAESGVDYISVGALTHSVKSLDMSLKAL
jgi:nicotinate-nucleotide pyrophosphorylase (carboxylating)